MTSEAECLDALREAAARLGGSQTRAQYDDLGLTLAATTIMRVVGGWNEAKEKVGLETYASRGSRIQPKPEDVEFPDGMVWEELTVDQRWHYRNAEVNARRSRERRARLRALLHAHKLDCEGCTRCGEADPACLDFHHRDKSEKEMAVSKMVPFGY